jgi:hypothetical protein
MFLGKFEKKKERRKWRRKKNKKKRKIDKCKKQSRTQFGALTLL